MKKEVIGHMPCPTCKREGAEVKEDKNGHAFLFCLDCATQVFTRNPHRDHHMRKNMTPVTVTVTEPPKAPEPAPAPKPPAAPPPAPKPPKPAPPAPPAPPAKPKSAWFSTLLDAKPEAA